MESAWTLYVDADNDYNYDSDEDVTLNQEVAIGDIANLQFVGATNGNGSTYATFQFQVHEGTVYSDGAGINTRMVQAMTTALPAAGGHWFGEHLPLTVATLPLDFLMDSAAVGAVATPSLLAEGADAGLSALASAMSVAMATTVAFLPYQAAPFMAVLGFGTIRARDLSLAMLLISTLSVLLLCPLNILYWRALGLI